MPYFLMTSDNTVHTKEFVSNHVTGIFFDNKAAYATWYHCFPFAKFSFSKKEEMARKVFSVENTEFIEQEWDDILSKEPIITEANTTNAWLSLPLVNEAVVDQADALSKLQEANIDDGLTSSWALYVATCS
ncbi:hypothetical protein PHYPSEUDO_001922 [Phytophthora pseudosyringae]|uniref:glucan endo-1,3-beta-D-glucosidase n=1 Tax=Phytophthora pseudosyringae TaxID=221518 RepID=A0A8T1VYW0_9STRA|nr:hypothetical protein PHYPSEUDO_001922 [Phytophthora pseudosyringae]